MTDFKKRLSMAQAELNAPKSLYNKFGNYYYRNAEGILEALKPLLSKHNLFLTLNDEIVSLGEGDKARFYVKAIATIGDTESDESISVTAFAREEETKKGMDVAMVTGSASSYARKYALNGLLCIDDNKDPDDVSAMGGSEKKATATKKPTGDLKKVIDEINNLCIELAKTKEKEMTQLLVKEINTVDYTTIKDIATANSVLEKLKKL